tara:strand:- start:10 stop:243 length:234 start_codon:yes stop_codon:yes gene_type:complete
VFDRNAVQWDNLRKGVSMNPTILKDEDIDRRAHVSWSEAVGRIERIVMDTVEDLEKKEGGDIYAQELLSCWKRIVKG